MINFLELLKYSKNTKFTNESFDALYPKGEIRDLSSSHWTPVLVAEKAIKFLSEDVKKPNILDIGSGVGKFCILGGYYNKEMKFTGIEQRKNYVDVGNNVVNKLKLTNVNLIHGNFMDMDISQYNGIYFYNSFFENTLKAKIIEDNIECNMDLFVKYTMYLIEQLNKMPIGTRLATYFCGNIVPQTYILNKETCKNFGLKPGNIIL